MQLAGKLKSPIVSALRGREHIGSSYFYAMEFVEGETLEKLIKRSGRLDVKLALEIAPLEGERRLAATSRH
jgi:serine/threonine protein kinase